MLESNSKLYMKQKFVALLIILLGDIALIAFGLITPQVFQTITLWVFGIFAGSDALESGTIQIKDFMVQKKQIVEAEKRQAFQNGYDQAKKDLKSSD